MNKLLEEIQALKDENAQLRAQLDDIRKSDINAKKRRYFEIFKRALDTVPDAVAMVDPSGDIKYANRKFLQIYNVDVNTFCGKVYDLNVSFHSKEAFDRKVQEIREHDNSLGYEATTFDNDGEHTNEVSVVLLREDDQDYLWFFMRDITELIQSRDKYRELNYLMDSILYNLPVYLFVKDVDDNFRYLYWNKSFAEYSKIPASQVIGRTDFEVFPDRSDAEKFRKDDMELVETHGSINRHETYMTAAGDTRLVQTLKILVPREGRGPLLIGVSWDITNMQNIEQELVRERLRADQSDRLKSVFLANMSHEVRTPLNAIVGFSGLLADAEMSGDKKMYADIIRQNSEVLLQLINDILDISKIEAGTLEYVRAPMDLSELFRNVYEMYRHRTRSGVELKFANPEPLAKVIINEDCNRVQQVITNLITNAIKFTSKGEITFGFDIKGHLIEAYVKDTGIGIQPEKVDQVFDRFVKLNTFAQGSGLGLAISKMIVDTWDGDIWVDTHYGRGSVFHFTIPYLSHNAMADKENVKFLPDTSAPKDIADSPKCDDDKPTILVAEDVQSNYLLLEVVLRKNYRLLWAKDGGEAVKLFKQHHPDLILMDIKMPNIDGLEAARLIRTYSSDVPIVGLSAYAFEADKQKAFEVGFNDYLTKPVHRALLEATIKKFIP